MSKLPFIMFTCCLSTQVCAGDITINGSVAQTIDNLSQATINTNSNTENSIVAEQIVSSKNDITVGTNGSINQTINGSGDTTITVDAQSSVIGGQVINAQGDINNSGTITQTLGTVGLNLTNNNPVNTVSGVQIINSGGDIKSGRITQDINATGKIQLDLNSADRSTIGIQVVQATNNILADGDINQTIETDENIEMNLNGTLVDSFVGVQVTRAGNNLDITTGSVNQNMTLPNEDVVINHNATESGSIIGVQMVLPPPP